jgi:hypothetical protein
MFNSFEKSGNWCINCFNIHWLWIFPTEFVHGILSINSDYFQNSVNQLIFVMVKCSVFFEVGTEFLNIMETSFGLQMVTRIN